MPGYHVVLAGATQQLLVLRCAAHVAGCEQLGSFDLRTLANGLARDWGRSVRLLGAHAGREGAGACVAVRVCAREGREGA